jgi:hypothetical protein
MALGALSPGLIAAVAIGLALLALCSRFVVRPWLQIRALREQGVPSTTFKPIIGAWGVCVAACKHARAPRGG